MKEELEIMIEDISSDNFSSPEEHRVYIEGFRDGATFIMEKSTDYGSLKNLRQENYSLKLRLKELQGWDI